MFENVTYTFYSSTLGRAVIPDSDTFDSFKMLNIQKMKSLLPYVEEKETNGIDSSVCMMIEADYVADANMNQKSRIIASENVSGHSVSFDNSSKAMDIQLNSKSLDEKKIDAIKLFCYLNVGAN